jgi:hypothetical protein
MEEFLTLRSYQMPFEKRSISLSNHTQAELAQVMWNQRTYRKLLTKKDLHELHCPMALQGKTRN